MIEFQIEKVKNLQEESKNIFEGIAPLLFQELCDVVLELLVIEKEREGETVRNKTKEKTK